MFTGHDYNFGTAFDDSDADFAGCDGIDTLPQAASVLCEAYSSRHPNPEKPGITRDNYGSRACRSEDRTHSPLSSDKTYATTQKKIWPVARLDRISYTLALV
jgi:hypothetical protein